MINWQTKKLGEVCDFVRGPFGGSLKNQSLRKMGMLFMSNSMQFIINLIIFDILLMKKNLMK